MVSMQAALRAARRPEAPEGRGSGAVWGVKGIMSKDILPDDPAERRRRSRLCALRAMDRLGLLGEENLIPTLARRPELRWLADEQGARWAVLAQLGRVGERKVFEEAVEWALEARPHPEEVRTHVLLSAGSRTHWPDDGAGSEASCGTAASQTLHRAPRLRRATRQEERRR
jgi:hypothetical protein